MITHPLSAPERLPVSKASGSAPALSRKHWGMEDLTKPVLCVPLVAQWLLLAARYGSLTLPSTVNPSIESGGLAGESKSACLAQIAVDFAPYVAAWQLVSAGGDPLICRRTGGFTYPLIVKPDIGWCGYGVQRIADDAALLAYAAAFPREAGFIMQRLVETPDEAGLFYVREPGERSGTLTAMTFRHAPHVVGDGIRCVAELIAADDRLRSQAERFDTPLGPATLARVPAVAERVVLTTIASLRAGARYEDATALITTALSSRVEAIAQSMPDFHFGRFDIRLASLAALQAGEFSIIEVNGAGSEAIQFWDATLTLREAFSGVFAKHRLLFRLGAQMRRMGHRPVGIWALARAWLRQQRLIARYPASN